MTRRDMPKSMRINRPAWMDNPDLKAYWNDVRAHIQARYDAESPAERPHCKTCGGIGWVRYELKPGEPGFGEAHPCPDPNCPAQSEAKRRQFEKLVEHSRIPAEYQKLTFGDWNKLMRRKRDPHGEHLMDGKRDALGAALAWANAYQTGCRFTKTQAADFVGLPAPTDADGNPLPDNDDAKCGLVLSGLGGMGKTSLAVSAAQYLIERGCVVVYVQMAEFFFALQERFRDKPSYEYGGASEDVAAVMRSFQTAPHLVIDELAQTPTTWQAEQAGLLFNYRMANALPTILTTNILTTDDLSEQWGTLVASRVQTLCHWMSMGGIPLRRRTSQQVSR